MLEVAWESRVKLLKGGGGKARYCRWERVLKESSPLSHAHHLKIVIVHLLG